RIEKFKAIFKNPTELEYVRQGLQQFRSRQESFKTKNVSLEDLQYIENQNVLQQIYDRNNTSSLNFSSIEEINRGLEDYLFEGDILLTRQQIDELLNARKKRQASMPEYRWDKTKPIYFSFDPSVDFIIISLFRSATKFWSDNICLNFVESKATPYIQIIADYTNQYGSSCWSFRGRTPGTTSQQLSLGSGCQNFGTVTHELAHALGIAHEHARYDRDSYITIIPENMDQFYINQFIKQSTLTSNNYGLPYDWGSVMHYRDRPGINGKIYALAKDRIYQSTMGGQYQPTFKDIYLMNLYYNCMCASGVACQNGGFRNPKNCNICICPSGFGDPLCNQRQTAENGAIDFGVVLTAPLGKRIEITIQSVSGKCVPGCIWGSLELKVRNFVLTGARYCCRSNVAANPILVTNDNFAIVSVYNLAYEHSFSLKYRYSKQFKIGNKHFKIT
uniref:Zinc metalloproteinase n=1 Tax=Panagrolaimus sp. ES5 TaxID=591445 RepID=A0AC34FN63_9BILA